ncbi:IS3 family transposase [Leucobacter luti]|uniref:IS3 family transposase n=1 Tax=Leucobacter luti TaxID=340320 RepID=UPI001C68E4AF|nr:IS3 family transposase [Leucobacter luti]QYM75595.1 IS3 family transposase [Leucobacter luti]
MPPRYPREFRDDVIRIALNRGPEVTLAQIAKDFGIHVGTLDKWLREERVEAGEKPGVTRSENAELRELRKRNKLLKQEVQVLRRAAAYLSQAHLPKRLYPLVRELTNDGIPVQVSCRVLKLSRQPYYRWLRSPVTGRELMQAYRANALYDAHIEDPEFGYRFLADEAKSSGEPMCDRTAWRLCRDQQWWSAFGKKKARGKGRKPGPPVHDDLVQREFVAATPNELWLSDITEHWTGEGKLYLCAVKDVWSNRIVGYSIASQMTSALAVTALNNAVLRRGDVRGCVLHTDRGSQFRSRKLQRALAAHGKAGSMGRVGAAGDNAAMESFFSLLQKNVLSRGTWATRDELRSAIVIWIERTYHRRRRQARLGRLTPLEYETIMNKQVALAA